MKNQPVILLCVLESSGSSPGRQGFKMAVAADGLTGSIGGGIMEHKFVELSREQLNNTELESTLRKQYHDKQVLKNQSGMICSGEQTIWIHKVGQEEIDTFNRIIDSLKGNRNGLLKIDPVKMTFSDEKIPEADFRFEMKSDKKWKYEEKTGYKNKLFIIGGGHCSLALSRLMRGMDFYIQVFDERPEINTLVQNEFAHEKIIVKSYAELTHLISSGRNHYVVIMTMGYRSDDVAFRALKEKEFKYVGILGSRSKMIQLNKDWKKDNIDENILTRIRTPIGISIHSQTPEEIAVSIAAEIIIVKNG